MKEEATLVRALIILVVVGLAVAAGVTAAKPLREPGPPATAATPSPRCDRFASPRGHDRAPGTAGAPVRSAQRLVRLLHRGETGCLRAGTYRGGVTVSRSRIALRSHPGERATIEGRLWVRHGADDNRFIGLTLNGRNRRHLPSPTVHGDGNEFRRNDVTNEHTAICFNVGSREYGRAWGTLIRGNRIHDCGRLPATNKDHGIYVQAADYTRIVHNVIYDNADRGVQLYPDAEHTLVRRNIIDGNGVGVMFAGAGDAVSSGNTVEGNVISNATVRANVESYFPDGRRGTGNVAHGNCLYGGRRGDINARSGGFTARSNIFADPQFADPSAGDFRLDPSSPCAHVMAGSRAPAGPDGQRPVSRG